jgi:rhodanese-related sulfurtransferase
LDKYLIIGSIFALLFGVYWYFIKSHDCAGYTSVKGKSLKKYLKPGVLRDLLENLPEDIWLIDVREEIYYEDGHLPCARNFPFDRVEEWAMHIPMDKKLILYCELSYKTQQVIEYLEKQGFDQMLNWGKLSRWEYDMVSEIEETP